MLASVERNGLAFYNFAKQNTGHDESLDVIELNVKEQPFTLTAFVKQMKTTLRGSVSK